MKRRRFLKDAAAAGIACGWAANSTGMEKETPVQEPRSKTAAPVKPRAITMWDFSWIERRWPGAGYEDWDRALDGLRERGYDAVRIDAFPHLVAENPAGEWTLLPVWDQQVWGSPAINRVVLQPSLNTFLTKCRERDIKVGLSTWFREDPERTRMRITSPAKMAEIWIKTLESIGKDRLLDTILYVDLCNEWPGDLWAPFFKNDPPERTWTWWHTEVSMCYMRDSIEAVRKAFPNLPLCYSFTGGDPRLYGEKDLSFFDLIEHHIWMSQLNNDEYYKLVGYDYGRFSPKGYINLAANFKKVYRERPEYWRKLLSDGIGLVAASARKAQQPLITTECWGLVDFKDWPLLKWDIIKELCELGVRTAAATGQWVAIATSNFCGPQFAGMWRDTEWHRGLTSLIKSSPIDKALFDKKIVKRI